MLDPDNDERYKCCANCKHWARLAPDQPNGVCTRTGYAHMCAVHSGEDQCRKFVISPDLSYLLKGGRE